MGKGAADDWARARDSRNEMYDALLAVGFCSFARGNMSAAIHEGRRRIPIIIPAEGRVRRVYTVDIEIPRTVQKYMDGRLSQECSAFLSRANGFSSGVAIT
jgi:hypothetical protein